MTHTILGDALANTLFGDQNSLDQFD